MYDFLLQIIVFSSLGIIIYMLARALPRIENIKPSPAGPNALDRFLSKLPLEKIDFVLSNFFEKLLRKLRVVVMKADNLINARLGKIKKTPNGSGGADKNLPDSLNNDKK